MISAMDNVLTRLDKVVQSGKGYKALCPAHPDRSPSLSVKEGDDGRVLMHCFGGCTLDEVLVAMGLGMADLFQVGTLQFRRNRIPGMTMRQVAEATEFERQVLYIIKADEAKGRAITPLDAERARVAVQRLRAVPRLLK